MSQIRPMRPLRQKEPIKKDKIHLTYIRMCDCLVCGSSAPSEAAHIRYGQKEYGKFQTGMGEKPSDCWVVPLCSSCHRLGDRGIKAQHSMNEQEFWKSHNIDPLDVARKLFKCGNDVPQMRAIVSKIQYFARVG